MGMHKRVYLVPDPQSSATLSWVMKHKWLKFMVCHLLGTVKFNAPGRYANGNDDIVLSGSHNHGEMRFGLFGWA